MAFYGSCFSVFFKSGYVITAHRMTLKVDKERIQILGDLKRICGSIVSDKIVREGPFSGMKYPTRQSVGSSYFPKLLGTYERELHVVIEEILQNTYFERINVGCGEGYYAVGIARRLAQARVYSFDTDNDAQILTKEMARLNGVDESVHVDGVCIPEFLRAFSFSKKGLIISDCEGFEKNLFSEYSINLSKCYFLIEVHDFIDVTVSERIKTVFYPTHFCTSLFSVDDIRKP
jgi:hypothetical protein